MPRSNNVRVPIGNIDCIEVFMIGTTFSTLYSRICAVYRLRPNLEETSLEVREALLKGLEALKVPRTSTGNVNLTVILQPEHFSGQRVYVGEPKKVELRGQLDSKTNQLVFYSAILSRDVRLLDVTQTESLRTRCGGGRYRTSRMRGHYS